MVGEGLVGESATALEVEKKEEEEEVWESCVLSKEEEGEYMARTNTICPRRLNSDARISGWVGGKERKYD